MPDFLKIASDAASRGLRVTPLRGKAPFLPEWNRLASSDKEVIAGWAKDHPRENCGVVATAGYWMLDVDSVDWFMENAPSRLPDTLVVRTGSGKLHLYFLKEDRLQKRAVMNPRWRQGSEDEPQKLLEYPGQVVWAGSEHPDTKKEYSIYKDRPVGPLPADWLEWLQSLERARPGQQAMKMNPLRAGWDPEERLAEAGLKFRRSERGGKVYLNYHADMGRCLVRGESHAAKGEEPNPRQSAFVWDPSTREMWHQCFSGGCQVPGKTGVALAALGLRLEDVVRPRWRELFESADDFEQAAPLSWAVEGLVQEEGMTMLAGLSGHGKTWLMLSAARALLDGGKLFGTFQCVAPPAGVLYLIPEVGRRSFWKRLKMLGLDKYVRDERLLVRTMSMGAVVPLADKRVLAAAKGRDVFLDTAVRFLEGEENKSQDNNLAETGFALLSAGARTWWGAHHSRKDFERERYMCLENVLRGTGDIGAMLTECYGVRQLDPERNLVHVECVKARDHDEHPRPFQVEGRPWLEREGGFRMVKPPGDCGPMSEEMEKLGLGAKGGRKVDYAELLKDSKAGLSQREIADKHGITSGAVNKALKKQRELDLEGEA